MSVGSSGLFGIITARNPDGKSSPSFRAETVNRGFWKATKLFAQNREGRKGEKEEERADRKTSFYIKPRNKSSTLGTRTHLLPRSHPSLPDGPRTYHHLTGQTERLARLPVQKRECVCLSLSREPRPVCARVCLLPVAASTSSCLAFPLGETGFLPQSADRPHATSTQNLIRRTGR